MIPFSAETKEGREEIWALIDSLIELPEHVKEELERKNKDAQTVSDEQKTEDAKPEKKARWKKTDRPVARKTLKKAKKKSAAKKKS